MFPYLHPSRHEYDITGIWPPKLITASPGLGGTWITKVDTFCVGWAVLPMESAGWAVLPMGSAGWAVLPVGYLGGLFFRRSKISSLDRKMRFFSSGNW